MITVLGRVQIVLLISILSILDVFPAQAEDRPALRVELVERAIATAEAAVPNPAFLSGSEWAEFKQTVRNPDVLVLDDGEFHRAFNEATDRLPFTHFRLHWQPRSGAQDDEPPVSLAWPREDIAVVRIRGFEGDPMAITETLNEVIEQHASALLIDLRGNSGGSFPTAVALSRALSNESIDAGAFLTRDWFAHHGDYPTAEQYEAIAALEVLDLATFAAQLQRDGAARLILPAHADPIFEGQLVILTDEDTASTSEPLVYLFQRRGVTVIGERTAGAMLSAEHFPMNETFRLFVPVADYVAPDGIRLDRRGVRPDIEVPGDQALERALRLIKAHRSVRRSAAEASQEMKRHTWSALLAGAMISAGTAVLASTDPKSVDLSWLGGCWAHDKGGTEEYWIDTGHGLLFGHALTVRDGALRSFEDLRIEPGPEGPVYVASPGGRAPVAFHYAGGGQTLAVFENAAHDFPQRIIYDRSGDRLVATITTLDEGQRMEFAMTTCTSVTAEGEAEPRKPGPRN